jgi:hypothetical protein
MKTKIVVVAVVLLFCALGVQAQNYPQLVPLSWSLNGQPATPCGTPCHIDFQNSDGSSLMPGTSAQVQVNFQAVNGPITYNTHRAYCAVILGHIEQSAECDDLKVLIAGCNGTWQSGQTCSITYQFEADASAIGDDQECDPNGYHPLPAFPDGGEGTLSVMAGIGTTINYSVQVVNIEVQIGITPTALDFGSAQVGTEQAANQTFVITNVGDAPLTINSITVISGAASYSIVSNECVSPIAPKVSCDVTVSFVPAQKGTIKGVVDVSADITLDPSEWPSKVALSGIGTAE